MANCFGLRTARLGAACPHGRPRLHFFRNAFALVVSVWGSHHFARRSEAAHAEDAADYITKLPKRESDLPEWQAAIEALMLCGRGDAVKLRIYDIRWSADKAARFALSLHDNFSMWPFEPADDLIWPKCGPRPQEAYYARQKHVEAASFGSLLSDRGHDRDARLAVRIRLGGRWSYEAADYQLIYWINCIDLYAAQPIIPHRAKFICNAFTIASLQFLILETQERVPALRVPSAGTIASNSRLCVAS